MQKNRRGHFICFEGGEGAGKGTVLVAVHEALAARGTACVATREPGGTAAGARLRKLLVEGGGAGWAPAAELLLMMADRAQHVQELIEPTLASGTVVLCDRYFASSMAYQGAGRGLPLEQILQAQHVAAGDLLPDLTLLLDVDPAVGLARSKRRLAQQQSNEDAFERLDLAFHQRVRESFLTQAAADPAHWVVIDAARTQALVTAEAIQLVTGRLDHPNGAV